MEDEQQAAAEKRSKWHLKKRHAKQLAVQDKEKATTSDVVEAVQDAEKMWKEKERLGHGRVQSTFHSFCKILNRHKSLLEMLPSQNEYFSVLCGAITTLINVGTHPQWASPAVPAMQRLSGTFRLRQTTKRPQRV